MSDVGLAQHPALGRVGRVLALIVGTPPIGTIGVFHEDHAGTGGAVCAGTVLQHRGVDGVATVVLAVRHEDAAKHVSLVGEVLGGRPQHVSHLLAGLTVLAIVFGGDRPIHNECAALLVLRVVLIGTVELAVVVEIIEVRHPRSLRSPCHADLGDGLAGHGIGERLALVRIGSVLVGGGGLQFRHVVEVNEIFGRPHMQLGAVTCSPRAPTGIIAAEHTQIGGQHVVGLRLGVVGDERIAHAGGGFVTHQNRLAAVERIPLGGVIAARDVEVDLLGVALVVFDEVDHHVAVGVIGLDLGDGDLELGGLGGVSFGSRCNGGGAGLHAGDLAVGIHSSHSRIVGFPRHCGIGTFRGDGCGQGCGVAFLETQLAVLHIGTGDLDCSRRCDAEIGRGKRGAINREIVEQTGEVFTVAPVAFADLQHTT